MSNPNEQHLNLHAAYGDPETYHQSQSTPLQKQLEAAHSRIHELETLLQQQAHSAQL